MLDAYKHDMAVEFLEAGGEMSPEQEVVWKELEEKMQVNGELTRQLARAEVGESKLNPGNAPRPPTV